MHILLADGDEAVLQSIELMLKSESFRVYPTDSGEEAIELGKLYDYDAIVLSETADAHTDAVIRGIRSGKSRTPILVVSGDKGHDSVVRALGVGADDYLTKPFHGDELFARIRALVRRSKGHFASKIEIGNLVLDIDSKSVTVNDFPVHLTGKEFLMLERLALRIGQIQTKESLLNALYGGMDEPDLKIIDVFVCKIRKKLANAGAAGLLETVWGRGYVISKPTSGPSVRNHVGNLHAGAL